MKVTEEKGICLKEEIKGDMTTATVWPPKI
jgi:hypothetical protein